MSRVWPDVTVDEARPACARRRASQGARGRAGRCPIRDQYLWPGLLFHRADRAPDLAEAAVCVGTRGLRSSAEVATRLTWMVGRDEIVRAIEDSGWLSLSTNRLRVTRKVSVTPSLKGLRHRLRRSSYSSQ
jgi:hypothetical protein